MTQPQPDTPQSDTRNPISRWIDDRIAAAIPIAVNYALPKVRGMMREELAEVVAAFDGRIDHVAQLVSAGADQMMGRLDDMVPDEELGELLKQIRDILGRLPRWPL